MYPTSALRETVVLIIFGIILVPIAAKRAQDAPGYWQTFSTNAEQSLASGGDLPWSSRLALILNETLSYGLPAAEEIAGAAKPNETIPVYGSRATRAETRAPLMLRPRITNVGGDSDMTTTIESSSRTYMAEATVTPRTVSADNGSLVTPTITKASSANKERWTLIWTGAAIAAVALFMSFC